MNHLFYKALQQIYPSERLLTRDVELLPYESDALTAFQTKPGAVVLPLSEDEIIAAVRQRYEMDVPFVASGWAGHLFESDESHQADRPTAAHCGCRAGRGEPAYHAGSAAIWSLLCARSIKPVDWRPWREYRLSQRRRPWSEIWHDQQSCPRHEGGGWGRKIFPRFFECG